MRRKWKYYRRRRFSRTLLTSLMFSLSDYFGILRPCFAMPWVYALVCLLGLLIKGVNTQVGFNCACTRLHTHTMTAWWGGYDLWQHDKSRATPALYKSFMMQSNILVCVSMCVMWLELTQCACMDANLSLSVCCPTALCICLLAPLTQSHTHSLCIKV